MSSSGNRLPQATYPGMSFCSDSPPRRNQGRRSRLLPGSPTRHGSSLSVHTKAARRFHRQTRSDLTCSSRAGLGPGARSNSDHLTSSPLCNFIGPTIRRDRPAVPRRQVAHHQCTVVYRDSHHCNWGSSSLVNGADRVAAAASATRRPKHLAESPPSPQTRTLTRSTEVELVD